MKAFADFDIQKDDGFGLLTYLILAKGSSGITAISQLKGFTIQLTVRV